MFVKAALEESEFVGAVSEKSFVGSNMCVIFWACKLQG
jgi:hypothetical protein